MTMRGVSGIWVEQHKGERKEGLGKDYRGKLNTQKGRPEKRGKQQHSFF